MKCYDSLSGETFEIDGREIIAEIEQWVADGIDLDSGLTEYDVYAENGTNYIGVVDPADYY